MSQVTFESIKNNHKVKTFILKADELLEQLGYTEHSMAHVGRCAQIAGDILLKIGHPQREAELARIAGYLHDIGNSVNRIDHAQSGAIMAFKLLDDLSMEPEEIATVIAAIGNHDEETATPVSAVTAALILADKSDVRRSRVRNKDTLRLDIHDRVNYAVKSSDLSIGDSGKTVVLKLDIDTSICPVMDYFEIFLGRMMLCKKAAHYLGLIFELVINGVRLL